MDAFNLALTRVFDTLQSGVGRNIGSQTAGLPQSAGTKLEWAKSRSFAEKSQGSATFERWLDELLREPWLTQPVPVEEINQQSVILNDLATMATEAIELDVAKISLSDFSMEPLGFGPPLVQANFQWIAITYVQQSVMTAEFGWPDGQVEDFLRVYEAGHLPVGCVVRPLSNTLYIW